MALATQTVTIQFLGRSLTVIEAPLVERLEIVVVEKLTACEMSDGTETLGNDVVMVSIKSDGPSPARLVATTVTS